MKYFLLVSLLIIGSVNIFVIDLAHESLPPSHQEMPRKYFADDSGITGLPLAQPKPIISSSDQNEINIAQIEQETNLNKLQQIKLKLENMLKSKATPANNLGTQIQREQRRLQKENLAGSPIMNRLSNQQAVHVDKENEISRQLKAVRQRIKELQ